jgi:hypothetical protein
LGDAQVDLVKEFKEKLKQTEYNIEQVSLREQLIMQRLSMAKDYQSNIDSLIRDMDSIGKTRAELKQEKESQKAQKDAEDAEKDEAESQKAQNDPEDAEKDEAESQKAQKDAEGKDAKGAKKQATTQTTSDPSSPDNLVNTDEKEPEKKKVGNILERLKIKGKKDKTAVRKYFKKTGQKFDPKTELNFGEAKQMYLSFLYDHRKIDDASVLDDEEKKLKRYFGIKDED